MPKKQDDAPRLDTGTAEKLEAIRRENYNYITDKKEVVLSKEPGLIDWLKQLLPLASHADDRELVYVAIACAAKNQQNDQSAFIFENIVNEKNTSVIRGVLGSMKGLKVPVIGQMNAIQTLLQSKKREVREGAQAALGVCFHERDKAEDLLIDQLKRSTNASETMFMCLTLMEMGTVKCIPAIVEKYHATKGLDATASMFMAIRAIDPIGTTDVLMDVLQNRGETYSHQIALSCLAKSKDPKAIETVIAWVGKILTKKPRSREIDYQDEVAPMISALSYLNNFKNEPHIAELILKIKNEKHDFLDFPTLEWVKFNLN
ncbi:MAG TPA: hypothetical protein VK177_21195 [Flavobacteriales bacterium]|nr:hypothetical protein [Flavobacteriales bacterium]